MPQSQVLPYPMLLRTLSYKIAHCQSAEDHSLNTYHCEYLKSYYSLGMFHC